MREGKFPIEKFVSLAPNRIDELLRLLREGKSFSESISEMTGLSEMMSRTAEEARLILAFFLKLKDEGGVINKDNWKRLKEVLMKISPGSADWLKPYVNGLDGLTIWDFGDEIEVEYVKEWSKERPWSMTWADVEKFRIKVVK